jgi:hypothetical protein
MGHPDPSNRPRQHARQHACDVQSRSEEEVAAVEEHAAAVHDAMAEQGCRVLDTRKYAESARRIAAAERAMAKAYRGGGRPPEEARRTLRIGR